MSEKTKNAHLSGSLFDVLRQAEEKGLNTAATEKAYNEYFSLCALAHKTTSRAGGINRL